jgi:hypothetical protein
MKHSEFITLLRWAARDVLNEYTRRFGSSVNTASKYFDIRIRRFDSRHECGLVLNSENFRIRFRALPVILWTTWVSIRNKITVQSQSCNLKRGLNQLPKRRQTIDSIHHYLAVKWISYCVVTDLQSISSAHILTQNRKGSFSWHTCFCMLELFRFVAVRFVDSASVSVFLTVLMTSDNIRTKHNIASRLFSWLCYLA